MIQELEIAWIVLQFNVAGIHELQSLEVKMQQTIRQ